MQLGDRLRCFVGAAQEKLLQRLNRERSLPAGSLLFLLLSAEWAKYIPLDGLTSGSRGMPRNGWLTRVRSGVAAGERRLHM